MDILLKNQIIEDYEDETIEHGYEFRGNIGNHRDSAEKLNWRLGRAEEIGRATVS